MPSISRTMAMGHACRRGFTLIEILVALAMMSVLLPVAMAGISIALSLGHQARQQTLAATLAQTKLNELLVSESWQSGSTSGDFADQAPGFTWIACTRTWTDSRMTELQVSVRWNHRRQTRSVTVGSLVSGGSH